MTAPEQIPTVLLVVLLIAVALTLARLGDPLAIAILTGAYSLNMAVVFTLLDAVDVAFTEAAVGAGITLTLMVAAISLARRGGDEGQALQRPASARRRLPALVLCLAVAAALVHASFGMPRVGDPEAPVHGHVAPRYIERSQAETGVPNMVTAVLASYRGFDTLGEVAVIFAAGVGVMALLGRRRERER